MNIKMNKKAIKNLSQQGRSANVATKEVAGGARYPVEQPTGNMFTLNSCGIVCISEM
ncbi:hypothetical protein P4S65_04645 [Pseudoalteromonas sp. B131b]|jgi:hypothetical protein|uniref:hypothetical protein n=1 Tax=Pseudoalteromonas TaxID=53246 RepID=UPI0012FD4759|nr:MULTISPECIES: hypothetical protein [Pseudoalteromonas]MDQ2046009.1 hypothetical protein [Pseudoalteromonas sp. 20-92]